MNVEERQFLFNRSLERAADMLGDITSDVMALYYSRCPDALAAFEHHRPGSPSSLEGEMVSQTLYCLMEWFENPIVVEIMLMGTIPHHLGTLHIQPHHFRELIRAVCHTVAAKIPADSPDENKVWDALLLEMECLFEQGAQSNWISADFGAEAAALPHGHSDIIGNKRNIPGEIVR